MVSAEFVAASENGIVEAARSDRQRFPELNDKILEFEKKITEAARSDCEMLFHQIQDLVLDMQHNMSTYAAAVAEETDIDIVRGCTVDMKDLTNKTSRKITGLLGLATN